MKNKTFVFFAIGMALIFASCTEKEEVAILDSLRDASIILTPEEYASVAYSGDNELSESNVIDIAQRFVHRIHSGWRESRNSIGICG